MPESPDLPPLPPAATAWLAGLRVFVARKRQQPSRSQRPPPLPAELAAEAGLIAAHLRDWLAGLPLLFAEHNRLGDRRPAIAITTSPAGLRAIDRLASEPEFKPLLAGCCGVTEAEYRFWCKEQPDPNHAVHANHWAWMKTQVPAARAAEFAAHPLPAGSRHWLFRHGLTGLGPADHHSCRLYAWNGSTARLLQDHFHEGVRGL